MGDRDEWCFKGREGEWKGGKEKVSEGITKGGRNGWSEGDREELFFKGREGGREGERERGREIGREGGRERGFITKGGWEEGTVLQRLGWMGGRMKIGMEGITKGVGR